MKFTNTSLMEGSSVVKACSSCSMLKFAAIQMDAPVCIRESSEERPRSLFYVMELCFLERKRRER